MRKRYILSAAGTIGASAVVGFLLTDKETKAKMKRKIDTVKDMVKPNHLKQHTILDDAGIPDQVEQEDHAQMENAKMVSEGSQFGVHYYNEVLEEEADRQK